MDEKKELNVSLYRWSLGLFLTYLAHGIQRVPRSCPETISDVGPQKLSIMFLARSAIWDFAARDVWLSVVPDPWDASVLFAAA